MQLFRRRAAAFASVLGGALAVASPVMAQVPEPWQMGLQTPHSPVAKWIYGLDDFVNVIIIVICLLVGGLLIYVTTRFSARRNPVPSTVSHNTLIEVIWTVLPIVILFTIAVPSFRLMYYEDKAPAGPTVTVKVTGHQWYWEYTYPDNANIDFTSYIVKDGDLKPGQPRLLTVDNPLVVPAGVNIRVLATSSDVIHSFFIPSLGVQRYAIPGRTVETWFRADQPGAYHGECNQICGTNHSFMPIVIKAVTPAQFQAWVKTAKTQFASNPPADPTRIASAAGAEQ